MSAPDGGGKQRPDISITGSYGPVLGERPRVKQVFQMAPQPVKWPVVVGRIPYRVTGFVERPVQAGTSSVLVLTGDGGVGKTELAAAHFRACLGRADVALWITASSRQAVLSTYQEAAALLQLDAAEADQATERLLNWLAGTDRTWIVVLDDVADPAHLRGLFPQGRAGAVLITTRRTDSELQAIGTPVDVEVFTPAESVRYLTGRLGPEARRSPEILGEAEALAADLGHLPLALAHASAVIIDDGITCGEYRELLRDQASTLAEIMPADPAVGGSGYPTTVPAAWSLALERADAMKPAGTARRMWNLISCLDANGIPEAVLLSESVRRYLAVSDRPVSHNQAKDALRNLNKLSLVRRIPGKAIKTHALAQRAAREFCDQDIILRVARLAADALAQTWPGGADAEAVQAAVGNTDALRACAPDALWIPDAHAVLFWRGRLTGGQGMAAAAARYFGQLASESLARLGPEHPDTFLAREEHAWWTGTSGQMQQAAALFGELLARSGPTAAASDHHAFTLRLYRAHFTGEAGHYADAAGQLEALIPELEQADGMDPAEILTARRELGRWIASAGQTGQALPMLREVLADSRRLLGPDHIDVLTTKAMIANCHGLAGDRARALREWESLVQDYIQQLGPAHPESLAARSNLARWRTQAGSLTTAAAELQNLVRDGDPVLGSADPRLLNARERLARLKGRTQSPEEAIPILEEVLGEHRRNGSWDDPETLAVRSNLASWRGRAGRPDLAKQEHEEILRDQRRVLGENHPGTLHTRHKILHWSTATGASRDELKVALDALVADAVQIGEPGHQVAFTVRNQLMSLRAEGGEDVTDELEQLVHAASDRFDAEDELMLTLRTNLLTIRDAKGDPAARRELRELLRVVESRLGAAHLLNVVIRQNLSLQPAVPRDSPVCGEEDR